jgi:hypothetical protein
MQSAKGSEQQPSMGLLVQSGDRLKPGLRTAIALLMYLCVLAALPAAQKKALPEVKEVGRIAHPDIVESSGLVASRQFAGTFWTHNDGARPVLYAIKQDGSSVGQVRIEGADFEDFEDIAFGSGNELFLGDIGNNKRKRHAVAVYSLAEPNPTNTANAVTVSRRWVLRYLGEPFDSEGLFVWHDAGYLVSKVTDDQKAEIFRFSLAETMKPQTLQLVGRVDVESPVAGADISEDGRFLAMIAKSGAFVFQIDGDVSKAVSVKPARAKFRNPSMEGCCFVPGGLLTCAESREVFFFSENLFGMRFK